MKRILITGAKSYIGTSFEGYAVLHYPDFILDTIDMHGEEWKNKDFSDYDTIFHVAGIAHADVGHVDDNKRALYYSVNTELAIETAKKAKREGVRQFIFMSSMIIYGDSAPYGKAKVISINSKPNPANYYGDSKWRADKGIRELADDRFSVAILRPPMIYGRGCKGNYAVLAKLAKKLPVFPDINNQRSMLYIENLCELLCQLIESGKGGVFFPQNAEYVRTSEIVREIRNTMNRPIPLTRLLNPIVIMMSKMPGRVGQLTNKAFGNSTYDTAMSIYADLNYQIIGFDESVRRTEGMMDVR